MVDWRLKVCYLIPYTRRMWRAKQQLSVTVPVVHRLRQAASSH